MDKDLVTIHSIWAVVVLVLFTLLFLSGKHGKQVDLDKINAGYVQCRTDRCSYSTIWTTPENCVRLP